MENPPKKSLKICEFHVVGLTWLPWFPILWITRHTNTEKLSNTCTKCSSLSFLPRVCVRVVAPSVDHTDPDPTLKKVNECQQNFDYIVLDVLALKSTMDQRFIKFWTQLDPLPWFIVIYTYPLKSKHLFKYQYCLQFYMNLSIP